MAAIPTILKGDDSGQITVTLPEGRTYAGSTLALAYQGVTRQFTNLTAGQTLSFGFTHEETEKFQVGCKPVLMRLIGHSGAVETVENAAMKVKVTDCLGEVNAGGSFVIRPRDISGSVPATDLGDLSNAANVTDLYSKVNQIIRVLARRSLLVLAVCLGLSAIAAVQSTTLGQLNPGSIVVTNVTQESAAGGVTPTVVTNISAACCSGLAVSLTNLVASATNSVPQITDGSNTIHADGTAEMFTPALSASWEPSHTPINTTPIVGDFYYSSVVFQPIGHWYCSKFIWNGNLWVEQYSLEQMDVGVIFSDPNATELTFPDGTKTYRRRTTTTRLATTNDLPTTAAQVNAYPAASGNQLATQVSTIGAYLNAEDARFVSTNYNSATHMPEAYVQVKLPDQSWSTVWREMTRWNWLTNSYLPTNYSTRAELDQKADRAWGYYDSHTGSYAPDGFTWISSPRIAIAADLAYQRTVTSEGAIWVLESSGVVTQTGGTTNGYFRISDDEQHTLFEIVKGNKRTIGADASSCQVVSGFTPTKLQIGYSIQADSHPTIEVCTNLTDNTWKAETDADCVANVSWSGSSGAYVAQVQGKANYPALFVKATYETGGESLVRNVAPVSMTHLYIGGNKYAVGTDTISGHTVLTLTPAN